jgi:Na+/melibiose symporter-like transporter
MSVHCSISGMPWKSVPMECDQGQLLHASCVHGIWLGGMVFVRYLAKAVLQAVALVLSAFHAAQAWRESTVSVTTVHRVDTKPLQEN